MNDLVTLRCSSLPMAFDCAAAVRKGDLVIDPVHPASADGTAGHAVMRLIAEGDLSSIETANIVGIAQEWGVDPDDLKDHALTGLWIWRQIRGSFIGGAGELELSGDVAGIRLTAHMDLFATDGARAHGADWKFGRLDRNYYHQMAGYMALVLKDRPELEEISFAICWMRDREIETYRMDRAGLAAWEARLKAEVVDWDGKTYRPNPNCVHCPRSHNCPALAAQARRDVAIIADDPAMAARIDAGLGDLPAPELVSLYRRAKQVKELAESLQDAVRLVADQRGPLPDGAGSQLGYFPTAGSRVLDPLRAWPILQERFTDEEIAAATKVSVSSLEAAVASRAGKGHGAQAKRELGVALDAAGAISRRPGRMFSDRRIK